jgi:hypothetical protein
MKSLEGEMRRKEYGYALVNPTKFTLDQGDSEAQNMQALRHT